MPCLSHDNHSPDCRPVVEYLYTLGNRNEGNPVMSTSAITLDMVTDMVSQLSPEERLRLVARIGADLSNALTDAASGEFSPGSASAVLRAMREPPHLAPEDVDELEQIIAAGKLPLRPEGIFDGGDAR